jgi:hypothetical protein
MAFEKCPECGETNYEEEYSYRTFDCGFVGFGSVRSSRCERPRRQTATIDVPVEVARYRLALLDAAQAADTIAADMTAESQSPAFAARCRELAAQMREFAGHTAHGFSYSDMTEPNFGPRRTRLMSVFRRR